MVENAGRMGGKRHTSIYVCESIIIRTTDTNFVSIKI